MKSILCRVLIVALLLPSFPAQPQAQSKRITPPKGLQFRLSEGRPSKAARQATTPATSLSREDTEALLNRLQPLKPAPDTEQEFAFRDRSLPPPHTGKTSTETFPAEVVADAPVSSNAALEVVRFAPEGEITLAPHLTITFSQPMVAVTAQEEAAKFVPAKLTPEVKGQWRWLSTKTLLFQPENRFPMATNFTVEIPAGTKSAIGNALYTTKKFSFSTPPPQVKFTYPKGDSISRNPLLFVAFDQRIDPASVLPTIQLNGANKRWKLRLATAAEIVADEAVQQLANTTNKGYWIAFRVNNETTSKAAPLPADTFFGVVVGPGTSSAEGTRTTAKDQTYSFRTYSSLRLLKRDCGYNNNSQNCDPYDSWSFEFTNSIDVEAFDEKMIRVTPRVENLKTEINGSELSVFGNFNPLTTYTVSLAPTIKDEFGQTLGAIAPMTFRIGKTDPNFSGPWNGLHTLDPFGPRAISYYSINRRSVRVAIYAVTPEQYPQFLKYDDLRNENKPATPPGKRVFSRLINLNAKPEEVVETRIDLSPALKNGYGHVVLVVTPTKSDDGEARIWVQSTNIGLDAFEDNTELIGWATSLKEGKAVAGAELMILNAATYTSRATTATNGLATIPLPEKVRDKGTQILVARKGEDCALLPEHNNYYRSDSNWYRKSTTDELRWHVFDDRAMYRPGEEVHVKGWVRKLGKGKGGDVEAVTNALNKITYSLKDSRGNEITKGETTVNVYGGFDAAFKLPDNINLGHARLELKTPELNSYSHSFQVQEFRRPEYEVTASASAAPHFVGSSADVTVNAAYFAGGGLSDAAVNWNVTATSTNFTPPNRGEFTFGKWEPWWIDDTDYEGSNHQTFASRTGADGKHHLHIDFDAVTPARPQSVKAEAKVTDVNRQQWAASSTLLVHPASLYVGLRADRTFVQQGEALTGQAIVTDLDGKAVAGRPIKLRATLLDWVYKKGEWVEEETNVQEFTLTSGSDAVSFRLEAKSGGSYRVTATILDDRERRNESEIQLWVAGGKLPPSEDVEKEEVQLIPNQREYHAGDTAELLVQAPFFPAEGVLTLRRSGIVETQRFTMTSASHTLKIPIKENWTPNIYAQVDLVGTTTRENDKGELDKSLPKRPAFASGQIELKIPPLQRKLNVYAAPRHKVLEPGGDTTVDLEVKDGSGKAMANSEVALVVVDEAILALSDYKLRDPLATFYPAREENVENHHQREQLLLANDRELKAAQKFIPPKEPPREIPKATANSLVIEPDKEAYAMSADHEKKQPVTVVRVSSGILAGRVFNKGGGAGGMGGSEILSGPIKARINFNPLATFAASVITDANGKASVNLKLPDSLTRYRVMAVATDGAKKFGIGESAITARLPLMVRPAAPRFLNFGDHVQMPVVLQNQTDSPMIVDVAMRATSAKLLEAAGQRITIPANDRVEVRFPVTTDKPGTANFQIAAATVVNDRSYADAAEISLPVWTPATTEAFATYGEVDAGAIVQPIKAPANAFTQFGGLEITTSSTQLQALTDAVLYLTSYPFECAEQVSSRVLAVAALRDVLTAFSAQGLPSSQEMQDAVARDLKRLEGMQNTDGGFGFWKRGDKSWPYLSIHVAHALQRAKEKGFPVPEAMIEKSRGYLLNIERNIPNEYPIEARRTLTAYSLYVLDLSGLRYPNRAMQLMDEAKLENLSLEAVGWLLPVIARNKVANAKHLAAMRQHLNNRVEETAAMAHFTTSYKDGAHLLLASNRRTDGILLEALINDQPTSDLIPKLVRGLLANRKQGRWMNTQENAFILLALDKYFRTYENVTPDFVARVWLGEACANEQTFAGRSTERHQLNVPMKALQGASNLTLNKTGQGRLYYRIGMQYAPTDLQQKAADYGFTVERTYEAIDDPGDVRRDADGTWRIKAGAQVRVRLTMVAPLRRYHVALVDALPAGFEALNPALKVTGEIPKDEKEKPSRYWWNRAWYEHQNLRDERVEAFTSLLWEGVYNYAYVARATTPGAFVAPAAKAEEMYQPETFGRSASDKVVIE